MRTVKSTVPDFKQILSGVHFVPEATSSDAKSKGDNSRLDRLAEELAALGSESKAQRTARRVVPWIASFALHGLMIVLGFIITWTVVLLQPEQEPTVIIADFDALAYEPITMLELDQSQLQEELVQDRLETDSLEELINEQLSQLEHDPLKGLDEALFKRER